MIRQVDIEKTEDLDFYLRQSFLEPVIRELRAEASLVTPLLQGRRIWMLNSTTRGSGIDEMLPKVVQFLRELGFPTEWVVFQTRREKFFNLTKRLHNLIHGVGDPRLGPGDAELYNAVSRETADALRGRLGPNDILVVHDPQPLGIGAILKKDLGLPAVSRCHIGIDEQTEATHAAWNFLRPHAEVYDHALFTAPEYIPDYLAGHSSIITPGIDPASYKNRELSTHKMFGIMVNAGLTNTDQPVLTPNWSKPALRLRPDGTFAPAARGDEIGLGFRPTVLQVSRWDRLKGWFPLLEGFIHLKKRAPNVSQRTMPRHRRRLEIVRLVLAGPDPTSIEGDPEGKDVLDDLKAAYLRLPRGLQEDVVLLALPMTSIKENALMVNVLQRCATLVVQNSLQEGFGLTVTEAMWKRKPVLGTRACGLRAQIRDGLEGRLNEEPENPDQVARFLDETLRAPNAREFWGCRAQRRVYDEFLVFTQVRKWLKVLSRCIERHTHSRPRATP